MAVETPPLNVSVRYTLRTSEWVWATAGLRPATLLYDTLAAALLLILGVWEADAAYLLAFWALSLVAVTSYLWLPWVLGRLSGGLRRATTPTELTLDEAGLHARTERGEVVTEWSAVRTAREVRGCLAIVQFSGRYRLIPRRAFTNGQLEAVRAFLETQGYFNYRSILDRLRAPMGQ